MFVEGGRFQVAGVLADGQCLRGRFRRRLLGRWSSRRRLDRLRDRRFQETTRRCSDSGAGVPSGIELSRTAGVGRAVGSVSARRNAVLANKASRRSDLCIIWKGLVQVSFQVDGEFSSHTKSTATAFSRYPKVAAWTCAAASPDFRSVWRHRCGRCRPLGVRLRDPHLPKRTYREYRDG